MLVLTMWQPHASLVAHALKRVESRGRRTLYRGEVAIHAARRWDADLAALSAREPFRSLLAPLVPADGTAADLPRGALIGRSIIHRCDPAELLHLTPLERAIGDYRPGRWGWGMEPSAALPEPIPWSGTFYPLTQRVPPELVARITAAAPL